MLHTDMLTDYTSLLLYHVMIIIMLTGCTSLLLHQVNPIFGRAEFSVKHCSNYISMYYYFGLIMHSVYVCYVTTNINLNTCETLKY